jgi:hypothetical protein
MANENPRGYQGYAAIQKEASWGTKIIAAMDYFEFESETVDEKDRNVILPVINCSRYGGSKLIQNGKNVGGSITWPVNADDATGIFLQQLLGTDTKTGDGTNGYIHAMEFDGTDPAGFTLQISRKIDIASYFGGIIDSLKFTFKANDPLKCAATMTFKDAVHTDPEQTPSYSTQNPLMCHTGTIQIGGSSANILDADIEISGGILSKRTALGSTTIQAPKSGVATVKGSLTAYVDAMTLQSAFLAGTATSLSLYCKGAAIGTGFYGLTLAVPQIILHGETLKIPNAPGELMFKIPFEAQLTGAGSPNKLILATLTNLFATAYSA